MWLTSFTGAPVTVPASRLTPASATSSRPLGPDVGLARRRRRRRRTRRAAANASAATRRLVVRLLDLRPQRRERGRVGLRLEPGELSPVPQQRRRVEVEEDEHEDPGEQDEELHRDLEEGVEEERQPALGEGPAREVALDLALVAPEVGHRQEHPADEPAPERVGPGEVERGVHRLQPARGLGEGQRVAHSEPGRELGDRDADAEEDSQPDEPHLDDVRPDHRAVATVDDVDDGRPAHERDRRGLAPPEDHGQHERGSVEGHADGQPPREEEEEARQGARARVEAALQVLVGSEDPGPVEEGNQGQRQHDHRERQAEVERHEAHALRVGLAGRAHEGDGADLGRHHREPRRPPPHLAPGQEEVVDAAGAPPHPHAEGHDADHVDGEDDPVGRREAGGSRAQNGHLEKRARSAITATAHTATATWIALHVPNTGTRSSGGAGGAVSGIGGRGGSARGGHYATISP